MQQSHWHTLGSLCNLNWGNYKLHNFPIGRVFISTLTEKTSFSITEIKLSLYEMNKDVEMYNSPHSYFAINNNKED